MRPDVRSVRQAPTKSRCPVRVSGVIVGHRTGEFLVVCLLSDVDCVKCAGLPRLNALSIWSHVGHDDKHEHDDKRDHRRSTALLADAAHNLGDVLGLGMAWGQPSSLAARARRGAGTA